MIKVNLIPIAKSGIHIKKENRGKFSSYCGGEVTEECIRKGKNSSNPAIRKRATFADNVRRWKHLFGGRIIVKGQTGFKTFVDSASDKFWKFGDMTGLYDKQGFNHMISDLQDFGIAAAGGNNGQSYGIVAPGVLSAERAITIPKGMSGETLSDIMLASKSNPAFNEAEKLALLDFQSQFGKGMPIATRRGRFAKTDAFGNNVRYPTTVPESQPILNVPALKRAIHLKEGVTGRQLQALKNRKAGVKTDTKQSRQAAYRDLKLQMTEDVELGLASRTAQEKAKQDAKWAKGLSGAKRGRKPVKPYRLYTQQLLVNRPNSVEAKTAGKFFINYTNAKDSKSRSEWLRKWSEFIDDIRNKGLLGLE